jgi:hypothetical protein
MRKIILIVLVGLLLALIAIFFLFTGSVHARSADNSASVRTGTVAADGHILRLASSLSLM